MLLWQGAECRHTEQNKQLNVVSLIRDFVLLPGQGTGQTFIKYNAFGNKKSASLVP